MNSRRFFFFSLIVLSFVMGIDWWKHRPKIEPKPQQNQVSRTRTAIKMDELLEKGEEEEEEEEEKTDSEEEEDKEKDPETKKQIENSQSNAQEPEKPSEDDAENESSDPVIASFKKLKRNPFEQSPYVKLIEQLKQKEAERIATINRPAEQIVLPKQLSSTYSGSIKTSLGLKAIINSKVYGVGDEFENKKIENITPELIILYDSAGKYLIPKKGVILKIAQDGTYTTNDSYLKKAY